MSEFIERSKHKQMTSAVESFFGANNSAGKPGDASGKGFPNYGSPAWNSAQSDTGKIESGLVNTAPSGAPSGPSQFNAPGQTLPRETGVNYKPAKNAGHRMTEDPFQLADGFPGNK